MYPFQHVVSTETSPTGVGSSADPFRSIFPKGVYEKSWARLQVNHISKVRASRHPVECSFSPLTTLQIKWY